MKTSPAQFRTPSIALIVVGVLTAAGCASSVDVRHQSALSLENSAYASFEIVDHAVGRSETVDELIEETLHYGMVAKGYSRAPAGEADLIVSYKILLSEGTASSGAPAGPPDDGLNGEAASARSQPVWDVVANYNAAGPQPAAEPASWAAPARQPVFDSIPVIDVSALARQTRDKTLLVMLQEPETYRVLWVGWSSGEVTPATLTAATEAALDKIVSQIPVALSSSS